MPKLPAINNKEKSIESPHVVILGAGASKAAFPDGDFYGMPLPLMKDLISVCGLEKVLEENGIKSDISDFESFYSRLCEDDKYTNLRATLDQLIRYYFSSLNITKEATLYDYLVLSLREKDIIASFNWDPFLLQAYKRNLDLKPLPKVVFLHGNVELGVCHKDKVLGYLGTICEKCRSKLDPSPLLYPTTKKDYSLDPLIEAQWKQLSVHIEYCYFLTIFGYSAPKTDVEARRLMHEAWRANETGHLAQVEIVDIKQRPELEVTWKEFTADYHYGIDTDIRYSWLFEYPRQTCEALFDATMQNDPRKSTPLPKTKRLEELQAFVRNLNPEPLHI